MRQTLHIFKKDVRHLWFEIAVAVSVEAGFAFTGVRQARWLVDPGTNRVGAWTLLMYLLPLVWWTLIARVIHDEAVPGDRQFWMTRPYSWKSLLGAKALFVATFINLPMLVADGVIVHAYGLPIGRELPGLLWSQILLTVAFLLPIAALSALTTGFVQLIFAILAPGVIALVVSIVAPDAVLGGLFSGLDWVRSYFVYGVITAGALAILTWQYSRRKTGAARVLAAAAGILAVLGWALIPWSEAFRVQSWFSRQRVEQSSVHVDFDSGDKWLVRALARKDDRVAVTIPLQISGLPAGMSAKTEEFTVSVEAPDGSVWRTEQLARSEIGQRFSLPANMDGSFYRKVKDEPLRVKGSLYLTLFGNGQTAGVPFGDHLVQAPRVGTCLASGGNGGQPYFMVCYSAFRSPPFRVTYDFLRVAKDEIGEVNSYTGYRSISYSPFPADLGISPVSRDITFSTAREPLAEVTVDTLEPRAYIERSFEINNLRLSDFETSTARPAR